MSLAGARPILLGLAMLAALCGVQFERADAFAEEPEAPAAERSAPDAEGDEPPVAGEAGEREAGDLDPETAARIAGWQRGLSALAQDLADYEAAAAEAAAIEPVSQRQIDEVELAIRDREGEHKTAVAAGRRALANELAASLARMEDEHRLLSDRRQARAAAEERMSVIGERLSRHLDIPEPDWEAGEIDDPDRPLMETP